MGNLHRIGGNLLSFGKPRSRKGYDALPSQIQTLRELDLSVTADQAVEEALQACVQGYVTRWMGAGMAIAYRARPVEGPLYTSIKDLWVPPAQKARAGRFNEAGHPLLYTASRPVTAILELRPAPRQEFVVLVLRAPWDGRLHRLMPIGIQRLAHTKLGKSGFGDSRHGLSSAPDIREWIEARRVIEGWSMQDDFISEIATRNYDAGDYRITLEIARTLRTAPESCGLLYPSVASHFHGHNYALYPDAAEGIFSPYDVWHVVLGDRVDPWGGEGPRIISGVVRRRGAVTGDTITWGDECEVSPDDLHDWIRPDFPRVNGRITFHPPPIETQDVAEFARRVAQREYYPTPERQTER